MFAGGSPYKNNEDDQAVWEDLRHALSEWNELISKSLCPFGKPDPRE
jgi:hypothetical protein